MSEYLAVRPRRLEASARVLPGRVRTMIHLAWLSSDPRARNVARAWHSLTAIGKSETHMEQLCRTAGISEADFIGAVDATARELDIRRCIKLNGAPGDALPLRTALGEALMKWKRKPPLISWPPTEWNRCQDLLVAAWAQRACDVATALRRRSRLSQSQFAGLFMTSKRTVRRWESGNSALTTHQQYFLRLFVQYVERYGVRAFRRRFVGEAPRYGRAGRPAH